MDAPAFSARRSRRGQSGRESLGLGRRPADRVLSLVQRIATCGLMSLGAGCLETDTISGCQGNADCAGSEVCNLLTGRCIPAPVPFTGGELEFSGRVECQVNSSVFETQSGVRGRLGGTVVSMQGGTKCNNDGGLLIVTLLGTWLIENDESREVALALRVRADGARGTYQATSDLAAVRSGDLFSGILALDEAFDVVALSEGGTLRVVRGSFDPGAELELELDVRLRDIDPQPVGAPCSDNFACDYNSALQCTLLGCSSPCQAQEDCSRAGGACVSVSEGSSRCLLPCRADSECDPSFHCAHLSDDYGVCAPPEWLGPRDVGGLGARCDGSEDCAGQGACISFGGEQGICMETCTDSCFYIGMDTECVAFADVSLCHQVCDAWKDCPDDLVCMEYGERGICVAPEALAE